MTLHTNLGSLLIDCLLLPEVSVLKARTLPEFFSSVSLASERAPNQSRCPLHILNTWTNEWRQYLQNKRATDTYTMHSPFSSVFMHHPQLMWISPGPPPWPQKKQDEPLLMFSIQKGDRDSKFESARQTIH